MNEIESEVIMTALRLLEIKAEQGSDHLNEIEIRVLLMGLRLWQIRKGDTESQSPEDQDAMDMLTTCQQALPVQSGLSQTVIENLTKVLMEVQS
jgi:hypothetical protein